MSQTKHGFWAVLPAYNEEASIASVILSLKQEGFHVLVVDDGSSDNTRGVAEAAGADRICEHTENRGYEAALNTGLGVASRAEGCQWCLTIDADGQFTIADITSMVRVAAEQNAIAVVGIRSWIPRWSECIVKWMAGGVTGLEDPVCGLKCFRADFVREYCRDAGRALNMYLAARAIGAYPDNVVQLPVKLLPRNSGKSVFSRKFFGAFKILRSGLTVFLFSLMGNRN